VVEDESDPNGGTQMTAQETVALYYDAWQNRRGDLSGVPLAEDFEFTGPVASFESAEGYRAMAREAGQAVTSFQVRRQFLDGNTVCSIIDWEMAMPGVGRMTSAELLDVEHGRIVRGELIYDAEALRRAMAQSGA
jgi:ketosteroid isomerase-like protein